MRKLIIAEKAGVGKAIADMLSDGQDRKDGYIEAGGYTVTWCAGHLLELKEPEKYDEKYEQWSLEDLPIFFAPWEKTVTAHGGKQYAVIAKLLKDSSLVIHAGDNDDEGQLIVDEILRHEGYSGEVKRVIINDNNEEQLRKAFGQLKENKEFEPLGIAAEARQVSDMVFGLNLSRFYCLVNSAKLTVGRVQTPTLGLIVNRDELIEQFSKLHFYALSVTAGSPKFILNYIPSADDPDLTDGRYLSSQPAESRAEALKGKTIAVTVRSKERKKSPPLPFNIGKLQAAANRKFGYSPKDVMDITQELRDKYKAITYNRTDSRYLNDEHFSEAPAVLAAVFANTALTAPQGIDYGIKSACFNSEKVTAHHAIIPTQARFDAAVLTEQERNIYLLVADYYIVQFMPPAVYEAKEAEAALDESARLRAASKTLLSAGYLSYLSGGDVSEEKEDKANGDLEEDHALADISPGEYTVTVTGNEIFEKETSPPKRYTLATLIEEMSAISKYVKDEALKKALLDKDEDSVSEKGGIGTSATRDTIIEKLLDPARGFAEMKGKSVISTAKGREFYHSLPDEIKLADVTARWWLLQQQIKQSDKGANSLIEDVLGAVTGVIGAGAEKLSWSRPERESLGKCPACGGSVYETAKAFSCEHSGRAGTCSFILWKNNRWFELRGKTVTKTVCAALLSSGKAKVKGFKKKDGGGTYDGIVVMKPYSRGDKYINFDLEFERKK